MTTIEDNEKTWASETNYDSGIDVGYVSGRIEYGEYPAPIYLRTRAYGSSAGVSLTIEQAREIAKHLGVLIETYEAAKPKVPTRAERWAAAPLGTLVTPDGHLHVKNMAYRVKVGDDTWVVPLDERHAQDVDDLYVGHERDFHPDWDIAGTNS